jgi:broad specificity phosphatase PhoE
MVIAIRHGETDRNVKGAGGGPGQDVEVLRGTDDPPLNAAGAKKIYAQAHELCQRYPVEEVRSTPHYKRAVQTRHIIAQVCRVPEVDAPEFAPLDIGHLSGAALTPLVWELIGFLMDVPFIPFPGGGTYGEYFSNLLNNFHRVYEEYGGDDSRAVVLVLFGNEFRALPAITEPGKPIERYTQQKVKPGDYVVIH